MKDTKEQIEVMTHYMNGGDVEYGLNISSESECYLYKHHIWNWGKYDYRIKKDKKNIIIEKWLVQDKTDGEFFTIETSDISIKIKFGAFEKIKLLEKYEVEVEL